MRTFIFGFASGLVTYHYLIADKLQNKEVISEFRSVIKSIDDRLADAEKTAKTPEPPQGPEVPTEMSQTPPPSPPMS